MFLVRPRSYLKWDEWVYTYSASHQFKILTVNDPSQQIKPKRTLIEETNKTSPTLFKFFVGEA